MFLTKKTVIQLSTVCAVFAGLSFSQAAFASSDPTALGTFGDWSAYQFTDDAGSKVCFMSSKPKSAKGNYTRRGDIHAYITHWPSKGHKNMINIDTGYAYKTNSTVSVSIDGTTFTLATEGEKAWAYDQADDDKISAAIQKGSRMVVKGTSSRGTATTDTYSLKGTSKAYDAISKACN
jgi:hypothetical protein